MNLLLIDVPYDCGLLNVRMGAGPTFLLERGLAESLRSAGHHVRVAPVRLGTGFHTEWNALLALQHQVAALIRSAVVSGERALVLSGNCGPAALGALGGLGGRDTAVVWLDAHADFNTPDTSPSGFLDGMAAATAVGDCWRAVASAFRGFEALPQDQLVQAGVRSVHAGERDRLERSRVHRLGADLANLPPLLDRLADRARHLYLHLDLDAIDPGELQANSYSTPGGLSVTQVADLIGRAASRIALGAASITALDPSLDPERAWSVSERLAHVIAGCPATGRTP